MCYTPKQRSLNTKRMESRSDANAYSTLVEDVKKYKGLYTSMKSPQHIEIC